MCKHNSLISYKLSEALTIIKLLFFGFSEKNIGQNAKGCLLVIFIWIPIPMTKRTTKLFQQIIINKLRFIFKKKVPIKNRDLSIKILFLKLLWSNHAINYVNNTITLVNICDCYISSTTVFISQFYFFTI